MIETGRNERRGNHSTDRRAADFAPIGARSLGGFAEAVAKATRRLEKAGRLSRPEFNRRNELVRRPQS